jgi:hypothetical protein
VVSFAPKAVLSLVPIVGVSSILSGHSGGRRHPCNVRTLQNGGYTTCAAPAGHAKNARYRKTGPAARPGCMPLSERTKRGLRTGRATWRSGKLCPIAILALSPAICDAHGGYDVMQVLRDEGIASAILWRDN